MYSERGSRYNDFDDVGDFFHAHNGWVNLVKGVLEPHTPERMSRRKSAVVFDKDARCPLYDTFLDTDMRLEKDQVRVVDQFSGLCLVGDISHQKMLTLIGRPGCGKSTLLNAWVHTLGDMSVERKLTELTGDAMRFAGSTFVGATLCWFDEVDVKKAEMGNTLGTLITGSHINIERKGVNGILRGRNTMKCVLTANRLPNAAELGIYRRLILIELKHSFSDSGDARLDVGRRLEEEASGILNRMIRGYQDLKKMGTFTMIAGHEDIIETYKAQSDTVAEFLDTYFEPVLGDGDDDYDDEGIEGVVLRDAYNHFTNNKSFILLTPQKFGRLLASQPLTRFAKIESRVVRKGDNTVRIWSGLRLKNEYEFDVETSAILGVQKGF
jgi:putative DNA primase/helicase